MEFQFRRFSVSQSHSAMKVGTDGVLLAALITVERPQRILDVGTGTGLIALILAQRTESPGVNDTHESAQIDAVEIDEVAATEAAGNFRASPWSARLCVEATSVQEFSRTRVADHCPRYDLIVCNPPFFDGSCPGDVARHRARHLTSLPPGELMQSVAGLMEQTARFSVIIPVDLFTEFQSCAKTCGLHVCRHVQVISRPGRPAKRLVLEFGFNAQQTIRESLLIEFEHHNYTPEYRALTEDYYLEKTFSRMRQPTE